jgi:hypothetical protein
VFATAAGTSGGLASEVGQATMATQAMPNPNLAAQNFALPTGGTFGGQAVLGRRRLQQAFTAYNPTGALTLHFFHQNPNPTIRHGSISRATCTF